MVVVVVVDVPAAGDGFTIVVLCSTFVAGDAAVPVALLFVASMLAFFFGLLWFLREIFVATSSLRIGSRRVHGKKP